MKPIFIAFTFLFLPLTQALQASVRTPQCNSICYLQGAMEHCLSEGASLDEITFPMIMKHLNKEIDRAYALPFEEMFQMMDKVRPKHPKSGYALVALTSMRVINSQHSKEGRYMLWWDGEHFDMTWEDEKQAEAILRSAGLTLVNRGTWQTGGAHYHGSEGGHQPPKRTPAEEREWLIKTRIEDGHDFGKPKPTREEVIRQLEAEGLIEKADSRWPVALGLAALGALLALVWKWRNRKSLGNTNE